MTKKRKNEKPAKSISIQLGVRMWKSLLLIPALITACVTTPVSNKSALILVSFDQEVRMGVQAYGEILGKEKISRDGRLKKIIERVGRRIAAVSDMPNLAWEFKLIDSKQQNAFALPGGKVAFYTGILPVCANEAGVAAVMGHEIAHAIARHGAQRMSQQMLINTGLTMASISFSNNKDHKLIMSALGLGASVGIALPFSRGNESEADEIGIVYMARAGYDPHEAVKLWQRFDAATKGQPSEFLSTHPAHATRVEQLESLLANALKEYEQAEKKYGLGESL